MSLLATVFIISRPQVLNVSPNHGDLEWGTQQRQTCVAGSQLDGGGPSMGGQRSAQNLLAEGEVDVHVLDLRHNIEVFLPAMVRYWLAEVDV